MDPTKRQIEPADNVSLVKGDSGKSSPVGAGLEFPVTDGIQLKSDKLHFQFTCMENGSSTLDLHGIMDMICGHLICFSLHIDCCALRVSNRAASSFRRPVELQHPYVFNAM